MRIINSGAQTYRGLDSRKQMNLR